MKRILIAVVLFAQHLKLFSSTAVSVDYSQVDITEVKSSDENDTLIFAHVVSKCDFLIEYSHYTLWN